MLWFSPNPPREALRMRPCDDGGVKEGGGGGAEGAAVAVAMGARAGGADHQRASGDGVYLFFFILRHSVRLQVSDHGA